MAADGSLQEPFMAKRIQATVFPIALAGGEEQRQIAWFARINEALFECH
jgi:hypothetical protein